MTDTARKADRPPTAPDTADLRLRASRALEDVCRPSGVPVTAAGPHGEPVGRAMVLPECLEAAKAEAR